jgi:hypothetical protein
MRSTTQRVIGAKRKMVRLCHQVQAFQHHQGDIVVADIERRGRQKKFAKRKKSKKMSVEQKWNLGLELSLP